MRGILPELDSPIPLAGLLPGMLADDGFLLRVLAGCDDMLAPVLSVLDNLTAYFDPALAPLDLVDWVGGWVGLPPGSSRQHVLDALTLHGLRGTAEGLRAELAAYGVTARVADPGGVTWSSVARGAAVSGPVGPLVVHVLSTTPLTGSLRALVREAVPAHLEVHLEQS